MGNCLSPLASSAPSTYQLAPISVEERVKVFTVAELKKATKNFGKKMALRDSFGKVVRGYINPKTLSPAKEGVGMAVAVKRFYLINEQALQEWLVDLEFLRLNSHPSLVKLIGYASDGHMLFTVCEYFPNGTLERHIYRETRSRPLLWKTRLKISIGAAQSLAFLHSKRKASVSRRYLSASKILLDSEFNAKVAYFGLKMLRSHDDGPHISSSYEDEPARFHYAPPEYICIGNILLFATLNLQIAIKTKALTLTDCIVILYAGKLNMSSDVYSFGVILLEILTGFGKENIILAKREIRSEKKNIAEMIDPDLENSYPPEAGRLMCEITKQCLEEDPQKRPSMQQVLDNLNEIVMYNDFTTF